MYTWQGMNGHPYRKINNTYSIHLYAKHKQRVTLFVSHFITITSINDDKTWLIQTGGQLLNGVIFQQTSTLESGFLLSVQWPHNSVEKYFLR